MLKYILLGFLNYQPMTGYDLKTVMEQSTLHFWHAYHSQIYTTLRKLETDGLVASEVEDSGDKLNRRAYTLTQAGRTELRQWLDQPLNDLVPIKEDLLVRLFFSGQRDPAAVLLELQHQRQLHAQKLLYYQTLAPEQFAQRFLAPESLPLLAQESRYWLATLQFGIRYETMYLAWLDDIIAMVESS
jgi:PadR family transcriptional regulator, regulatory protein AphA